MMSLNYQMVFHSVRYSILSQVHYKNHETLPTNPAICIYINRMNRRLAFKIKDGCKLELQTHKMMKVSGAQKY